MNTAINSTELPLDSSSRVQDWQPCTIVLQPEQELIGNAVASFGQALEAALEQVTETVIVDFLWVNQTDTLGIATLVAGIQRAAVLGKSLSLQSMNAQIRSALEMEWNRQREINFGPWSDRFEHELESFLDSLTRR